MVAITPNEDQFRALMEAPDDGPVTMLNLLKFKPKAEGAGGTGAEAYGRYSAEVIKMVEARGGRLAWAGRADQILIGDPTEDWDLVALVEYPSRKAFIDMVSSAEYLKSHEHREAGTERTILVACTTVGGDFSNAR